MFYIISLHAPVLVAQDKSSWQSPYCINLYFINSHWRVCIKNLTKYATFCKPQPQADVSKFLLKLVKTKTKHFSVTTKQLELLNLVGKRRQKCITPPTLQSQSLQNVAEASISFSCQYKHNSGQLSGIHYKKFTRAPPHLQLRPHLFLRNIDPQVINNCDNNLLRKNRNIHFKLSIIKPQIFFIHKSLKKFPFSLPIL